MLQVKRWFDGFVKSHIPSSRLRDSFETGLSDHHMIYTSLKIKFEKFGPKKLIYRNFKQFDSDSM